MSVATRSGFVRSAGLSSAAISKFAEKTSVEFDAQNKDTGYVDLDRILAEEGPFRRADTETGGDVEALAERFDVSVSAAQVRRSVLGLT